MKDQRKMVDQRFRRQLSLACLVTDESLAIKDHMVLLLLLIDLDLIELSYIDKKYL